MKVLEKIIINEKEYICIQRLSIKGNTIYICKEKETKKGNKDEGIAVACLLKRAIANLAIARIANTRYS